MLFYSKTKISEHINKVNSNKGWFWIDMIWVGIKSEIKNIVGLQDTKIETRLINLISW